MQRGGGDQRGQEVRRWLQIASITLAAAHRSPDSRHRGIARGARAPRCERRRPTIVYEMIMVARYEVAGSREAVRHLDWPVGSYKRREARARARGQRDYALRRASMSEAGARALFRGTTSRDGCRRETV